jgi:Domain of unknown function (DUF4411)
MPDFWFDSDSLVTPSRGAYRFDILPQFWDFLEENAKKHIFASSAYVYGELTGSEKPDNLELWARKISTSFFLEPDAAVQTAYRRIVDIVQREPLWKSHHVTKFLEDADPWVISQPWLWEVE